MTDIYQKLYGSEVPPKPLNRRQLQLLGASYELTVTEIAKELDVSVGTVKSFFRSIYRKLSDYGVRNHTGAVAWYIRTYEMVYAGIPRELLARIRKNLPQLI